MTELMLKLAAFLAMVIDHAAACRLDRVFFPAFSKVYDFQSNRTHGVSDLCLLSGRRIPPQP